MVDLSKHIARAKQALDRRQYDMAIEVCEQCIELDPTSLDVHRLLMDAAKRRAKENGVKTGMFGGLSLSFGKDAHKAFVGSVKRVAKNPDAKTLADAGDSAQKLAASGVKPMVLVAVFYYEEMLASGLFNDKVLWSLANLCFERYRETKEEIQLDKALKLMHDLEKAMPHHPEAARTIKNWEAMRSMAKRQDAVAGDYRSQLASSSGAKKAEAMNRIIRTAEDAKEVIGYIDEDLAANPGDKQLWVKKGDILLRVNLLAEAREAFLKAQALDEHDFTIVMKLGDIAMAEARLKVEAAVAAGQDATAAKKERLQVEIAEYRRRVERQPTDMGHRYNLGQRLIQGGDIDGAAAEFQKTVGDPRVRKGSHRFLGYCFAKKNLLDLACQQYTSYLSLTEDDQADEAKEVRFLRARVLEDSGKKDEALKDYERLVAIDLNYKDAAARLTALRTG